MKAFSQAAKTAERASIRANLAVSAIPSSADLVDAARRGEDWAQKALFVRHTDLVTGLVFRILGRDGDVDDVVQDSFALALTSLAQLNDADAFSSWLCGIAVNKARRVLRRRRLLIRLGLVSPVTVDFDQFVSPDAPAEAAAELRTLGKVIDRFPTDLRMVFLLTRVEGLMQDEIAEILGVSIRTIKRRLAAAVGLFERYTEDEERAC